MTNPSVIVAPVKHSIHKFFSIVISSAALVANAWAGDFFVKDGDRVVFLGDSITEQRLYTTYIEAYTLTRHPDWKLSFRNVGWGGDTSWLRNRMRTDEKSLFAADEATQLKMIERAVQGGLDRDVLPLKPTVVTIKFGMNDHYYQPFREDIFRAYVRSQKELATVLEKAGARVSFLTPQPIEDKRPDPDQDPKNQSLRKFSDGLKDVAIDTKAGFVDQFAPYMEIMMHERAADTNALIGGGDAVHPGPPGHTIMAWAILKGLSGSAMVSRAEIDCASQKVAASQGCRIEKLNLTDGVLSFDRMDDSLPFPIDPKAEAALKLAPILNELSRYELQVSGLTAKAYDLVIDGDVAARLSAEDLAKGCNLTIQAGPITQQARKVLELVVDKNNRFFHRWREVQLYSFPDWARGAQVETLRNAELARLDKEIAEKEAQIDAARKPKSHHFELKPVAQ